MNDEARHADLRGRDFRKILLIKLSSLGDVIHSLPLLNKLRRRYPDATIDWLVAENFAELLAPDPAISNVIGFDKAAWSSPWRLAPYRNAAALIGKLRTERYDLVIDLQGQLRSAVLAFGSRAPVRIGFGKPRPDRWRALSRPIPAEAQKHAWQGARERSWLAYTDFIPLPSLDRHPVERYLGVGPMLGLDDAPADFSFPVPPEAHSRIDALVDYYEIGKSPLVVLAPGTNWETKEWRSEGFAELARNCIEKKRAVVLVGSDNERALCEKVASLAPGAVDLAGETTLPELAALIGRAAACVTNDSGPMHLAVALGRPVLAIFGPTDPVWAGPYRRDGAVIRKPLPCSPCYLRELSRCPNEHACMREVGAAEVMAKLDAILAKPMAPARAASPVPRR